MNVYDVLKLSYADKNKQMKDMARNGYLYDSQLSNHNQQIYYNPKDRKLINSIAGTHNLSDWGTDVYLGAGHLKDTDRYKQADRALKEAKRKYNIDSAVVVGHSLGGAIAGYIAGANDKIVTYNKGATVGQKVRKNEVALRTDGDIVSILDENSKHMTTIHNDNKATGFLPLDTLKAHNVDNLKNANIFV